MITETMPKADVEAVVRDGGNFTKVGLEIFAENFFDYGLQHISKNREEMEEILSNLELNARSNGNEVCGAVMGKAVLLTFKRRQVVTDALSYLSRAAEKGIKGAAAELCAWYAGRIIANDLGNFPNADVGLDDCYDPTPKFPRQKFPRNLTECRRRLVYWLGKTPEADFDDIKGCFRAITGSSVNVPGSWSQAMERLEDFHDGPKAKARLEYAKNLINGASGMDAAKQIAEGAKIVRELTDNADCLDAWKFMLECHNRGIGQFKTNKHRRNAQAAISRLESN
jgi:hypothetical protein